MDRFYIITNSDKDPSLEITGKIVDYLKENKRRTIVTIIGIILSTALICGIGNISVSLMDHQIRETIANDGEFHATFYDLNCQFKSDKLLMNH